MVATCISDRTAPNFGQPFFRTEVPHFHFEHQLLLRIVGGWRQKHRVARRMRNTKACRVKIPMETGLARPVPGRRRAVDYGTAAAFA
jgi:hypothetical protein